MLPALFVSHGSPMLAVVDNPASRFLRGLGATMPRPAAVLVASAHWETGQPAVSGPATNATIHDFGGFPRELYELHYPAPGAPWLAALVGERLGAEGVPTQIDPSRGLDHGAWVPLRLIYPEADIPVAQISLQSHLGPAYHLALGRALAPLREKNILILGSGSFTHDLRRIQRQEDAPEPPDATAFAAWMTAALAEGRIEDLLEYRTRAPHAARNHPSEEHLLPLHLALGAAGVQPRVTRLHSSASLSALRMDAFAFA